MPIADWISLALSGIALIAAIGKIYQAKGELDAKAKELDYKLQRLQEGGEHRDDMIKMSLNQVKEVAEHIRSRTQLEQGNHERRLRDVENYLEKTTDFTVRHRD